MILERSFGKLFWFSHSFVGFAEVGTAVRSFDPALIRVAVVFARRFGGPPEDVEDIAQEALLKLITQAEVIEDPIAWLSIVVRRLTRRARPADEPLPLPPPSFDPWPAVELDIDARRLLEQTTLRGRRSFLLSLAGYSERENAAGLRCSVKAMEKALHRARREIQRGLATR